MHFAWFLFVLGQCMTSTAFSTSHSFSDIVVICISWCYHTVSRVRQISHLRQHCCADNASFAAKASIAIIGSVHCRLFLGGEGFKTTCKQHAKLQQPPPLQKKTKTLQLSCVTIIAISNQVFSLPPLFQNFYIKLQIKDFWKQKKKVKTFSWDTMKRASHCMTRHNVSRAKSRLD